MVTNGVHDGVQSKFSFEIPTSCSGVGFTSDACATSTVAVLAVAPATEHMCQEHEHFAVCFCWAGDGARSRTGKQRQREECQRDLDWGSSAECSITSTRISICGDLGEQVNLWRLLFTGEER